MRRLSAFFRQNLPSFLKTKSDFGGVNVHFLLLTELFRIASTMNSSHVQTIGEDLWSFRTISVFAICSVITILTILGKSRRTRVPNLILSPLIRQRTRPSVNQISVACSILFRLLHCQPLSGGFLRWTVRHASDDSAFGLRSMAIRLSSLLHLDVHRFHLFDRLVLDTGIDGLRSLLGTDRYMPREIRHVANVPHLTVFQLHTFI